MQRIRHWGNVVVTTWEGPPNVQPWTPTATDVPNTGHPDLHAESGTDAASFSIDRSDRPDHGVQRPRTKLDYETKNSYMVTVTATDPDGLSASIDVTIKVTDVDEAPEIIVGGLAISGPSSASYAENGTDLLVATYTLAGPNAATASWMRLGGDDAGDFMFIGGVLSFRSSPDYEAPADKDTNNVYLVTLTARDSEYTATPRNVVVTVTNVDDDEPVIGDDPLLAEYDPNGDGKIEKADMRLAVGMFFANPPTLSRAEMRRLKSSTLCNNNDRRDNSF